MNNKIFAAAALAATLTLMGCNDDFLDKPRQQQEHVCLSQCDADNNGQRMEL